MTRFEQAKADAAEMLCEAEPAGPSPKTGTAAVPTAVPCCEEGAKLTEHWVERYKCPVHGWQDWKLIATDAGLTGDPGPAPEPVTKP